MKFTALAFKRFITTSLFVLSACAVPCLTPDAKADSIVYVTTSQSGYVGGTFGTLDLGTGAFTLIATESTTLSGLGVAGDGLYGSAAGGSTFYGVDPANGDLTAIGNSGFDSNVTGSTSSGIFGTDEGVVQGDNLLISLYAIDPGTGGSRLLGDTNITFIVNEGSGGMSNGSSTLYYETTSPNGARDTILYSLNTVTGVASEIGDTGLPYPGLEAMVFADGTLYAAGNNDDLYTLNTTTGQATYLEGITGLSAGTEIVGMAQLPSDVPEPATLTLLVTGIAAMSRRIRRARR
jgi:hypothetical protein